MRKSWVEEKSVEQKDAQPTERTAALWGLSSKINSRICVNFTRNGLRLGSRHQEHHTQTYIYIAFFSDESKFCISFGDQGPRVWRKGGEAQSPSCLKSSVKFPQSVMIWVQCHLLVLLHCVFWKPTSLHTFTKTFWSTSCFLLLTSFLKMLISFSSRIWRLPTLPKAPKDG